MRLTGKQIAILLADGVEDLEFYVPLMRLQEEGANVLAAEIELKPIRGKNGLEITPTVRIESLRNKDLFAVVVPGGWAPDKLRRYAVVTKLVQKMDAAGKPVGIICHGGLVAISAGIVRGRRATGSLGIKDDLVNAGATWAEVCRRSSSAPSNSELDEILSATEDTEGKEIRNQYNRSRWSLCPLWLKSGCNVS